MLASALLMILGVVWIIAALNAHQPSPAALVVFLFGFVGTVASRIGAWWFHG